MKKIVERLIEVERQLSEVKALYKERQNLIEQLAETGRDTFETPKYVLILLDQFEKSLVQFKTASFCRFEVVIQNKKRRVR